MCSRIVTVAVVLASEGLGAVCLGARDPFAHFMYRMVARQILPKLESKLAHWTSIPIQFVWIVTPLMASTMLSARSHLCSLRESSSAHLKLDVEAKPLPQEEQICGFEGSVLATGRLSCCESDVIGEKFCEKLLSADITLANDRVNKVWSAECPMRGVTTLEWISEAATHCSLLSMVSFVYCVPTGCSATRLEFALRLAFCSVSRSCMLDGYRGACWYRSPLPGMESLTECHGSECTLGIGASSESKSKSAGVELPLSRGDSKPVESAPT